MEDPDGPTLFGVNSADYVGDNSITRTRTVTGTAKTHFALPDGKRSTALIVTDNTPHFTGAFVGDDPELIPTLGVSHHIKTDAEGDRRVFRNTRGYRSGPANEPFDSLPGKTDPTSPGGINFFPVQFGGAEKPHVTEATHVTARYSAAGEGSGDGFVLTNEGNCACRGADPSADMGPKSFADPGTGRTHTRGGGSRNPYFDRHGGFGLNEGPYPPGVMIAVYPVGGDTVPVGLGDWINRCLGRLTLAEQRDLFLKSMTKSAQEIEALIAKLAEIESKIAKIFERIAELEEESARLSELREAALLALIASFGGSASGGGGKELLDSFDKADKAMADVEADIAKLYEEMDHLALVAMLATDQLVFYINHFNEKKELYEKLCTAIKWQSVFEGVTYIAGGWLAGIGVVRLLQVAVAVARGGAAAAGLGGAGVGAAGPILGGGVTTTAWAASINRLTSILYNYWVSGQSAFVVLALKRMQNNGNHGKAVLLYLQQTINKMIASGRLRAYPKTPAAR